VRWTKGRRTAPGGAWPGLSRKKFEGRARADVVVEVHGEGGCKCRCLRAARGTGWPHGGLGGLPTSGGKAAGHGANANLPSPSINAPLHARGGRGAGFSADRARWVLVDFFVHLDLWVVAYRLVPRRQDHPITMLGDVLVRAVELKKERGLPISQFDREHGCAPRFAGRGTDKFGTTTADFEAIEDAMKAQCSGGRIRGGSTISQQTAKDDIPLWNGGRGDARKR